MDIAIERTKENQYLLRKEVYGTLTFTGATPSQKQLADALATKLNAKADAIFVVHLYTAFGKPYGTFEAHVYPSKEQLNKIVRLGTKAKEKNAKAAPAPAAAPAEAKKEEPKAEAKKEEAKA